MADSIRIEIPVSVKDNSGAGVKSVQNKLTGLEEAIERMERKLARLGGESATVSIDASDSATNKLASVDDALSRLSGASSTVSIDADDAATQAILSAEDQMAQLDGSSSTVDIEADDAASGVIGEVSDATSQLNGSTATVDVQADDAATGVLDSVSDKASSMNGQLVNIVVQATDSAGNALDSAGHNLWGQAGKVAGVMGASFGILDSINTYSGFEAGMDQVLAISGATEDEFAALTEKAKEMGATTKFTATESATAMNYMAMADWKAGDMISGISGIMNLAAASGEDLGTTSDIVTDALTAFGLQASDSTHFADVMAQAAANANTNVGMMGESFKYVAPVAGALGYDIEDVALALGIMANSGIKSSMAGTSLRRALSNLASPTKQQREAMEQYGMSLTDGSGRMKTLAEIMTDMRDNLGGLEADEQAAAVSTMFGNQAMSGMLAIINASEKDYNKLADAIDHADGASQRMADTMLDNMQGSFTLMQSAIEGVEDDLGEGLAPLMRLVADSITEAMPGASEMITNFFNGFNEDLEELKNSKAWKDADIVGKIDLAWDKLIADPLQDWIDGNGATTISGMVSGLFEKAFALLPGGESPTLSSWLSGGVLFLVGEKIGDLTTDVYNLGSAIGSFKWGELSTGGMIAVGLAGAVAAAEALNIAIDTYNQKEIGASLEEHFGTATLSEEDLSTIANQILDASWTVHVVDLAVDMGDQAKVAHDKAEDAINKNEAIAYKAKVGVTLTQTDLENYQQNVETFIGERRKELEAEPFKANLLVDTFLKDSKTGQELSSAIDSWTLQDNIEMSNLSAQLTEAVDQAISNGILDAGETQHIAELQQKINDITNRWNGYESEAKWDVMGTKYGQMTGEQLSGGSYQDLVAELQEHREANNDRLDQATEQFYTLLHAMDDSGRLDEIGLSFEEVQSEWDKAMQYERNRETANSLMFQTNTLNGAYSDEISSWNTEKAADRQNTVNTLTENMGTGLEYNFAQSSLGAYQNQKADKGLASLYEQMLPDVNDMQTAIQQYMQDNQAVPKALYESFMEAMQIGAASGDESAGWQMMANDIAQSGNEALIQAIQNGNYGPELQKAMEMSLAETAEDSEYTIDSVTAKINGAEVDEESAENVRQSVQDFMDAAEQSGAEIEYDAGNVNVTVGEGTDTSGIQEALGMTEEELSGYKVEIEGGGVEYKIPEDQILSAQERAAQEIAGESGGEFKIDGGEAYVEWHIDEGQTLSGISEATGVAMEQIAQMNGIQDMNVIQAGATIKIPADSMNVDTASMTESIQTDIDEANKTPYTTAADTTVEEGDTDATAAAEGAYNSTDEDIKTKFATGFEATAPLSITLQPTLANPNISVGLSGQAPGPLTASIGKSATGRYVDSPFLSLIGEDGPEYVVPVGADKKDRGIELWEAAGRDLGILPDSVPAYADGGFVGSSSGVKPSMDATNSSGNNQSISVSVQMAPQFTIGSSGGSNDADEIMAVIRRNMGDVADEMCAEIGNRLKMVFDNMPKAV